MRFVLTHFDQIERYLPNRDLDTGLVVKPGGYPSPTELRQTPRHDHEEPDKVVPNQLKHDLIAYYADPEAPIITKKDPEKWAGSRKPQTLATMKTLGRTRSLAPGNPGRELIQPELETAATRLLPSLHPTI